MYNRRDKSPMNQNNDRQYNISRLIIRGENGLDGNYSKCEYV